MLQKENLRPKRCCPNYPRKTHEHKTISLSQMRKFSVKSKNTVRVISCGCYGNCRFSNLCAQVGRARGGDWRLYLTAWMRVRRTGERNGRNAGSPESSLFGGMLQCRVVCVETAECLRSPRRWRISAIMVNNEWMWGNGPIALLRSTFMCLLEYRFSIIWLIVSCKLQTLSSTSIENNCLGILILHTVHFEVSRWYLLCHIHTYWNKKSLVNLSLRQNIYFSFNYSSNIFNVPESINADDGEILTNGEW